MNYISDEEIGKIKFLSQGDLLHKSHTMQSGEFENHFSLIPKCGT